MASDTIVALSTPPGRGAIGLVRISGPAALHFTSQLVDGERAFAERRASLRNIQHPKSREVLDQALVTYFKAPASFTGEDMVELSCHGSPLLIRKILDALLDLGARLAGPGEFSLRALSNGKISLCEAEAIRDLINARTESALHLAARQLRGELSAALAPYKSILLDAIVLLESAVEFVEDDLPSVTVVDLVQRLTDCAAGLGSLAETFGSGRYLVEGLRVAIVGRPNVGKSSLYNRILGSDRAIVSGVAGTTRDVLKESLDIHGIPVQLYDTAGLREATDELEELGVERTKREIVDADLVLVVLDSSRALERDDEEVLAMVEDMPTLVVLNKVDLGGGLGWEYLSAKARFRDTFAVVRVSAITGEGVGELQDRIAAKFEVALASDSGFVVTNARHFDLISRAVFELEVSCTRILDGAGEEVVLISLQSALRFLCELTGETTSEDILGRIFSTFCIGK